ncbi:hypothetical protein Tco_0177948 [Tanacetum coccineum]
MYSASSAVTYTFVYTDSEPGRTPYSAGSPPSPDYIPDSEEPQIPPVPQDEDEREPMFIQPLDPDYVSEPIYPEYIPLEDAHEFLLRSSHYLLLIHLLLSHQEDGDDDDGDSSGDDTDDEDEEDKEDDEEGNT